MSDNRKGRPSTRPKKNCTKCNKSKDTQKDFYTSNSALSNNRVDICTTCMNEMIKLHDGYNMDVVHNFLMLLDTVYDPVYWESAIKSKKPTFGAYISMTRTFPALKDRRYKDSVTIDSKVNAVSLEKEQSIPVVKYEPLLEEVRVEEDCIRLLGYDPFEGYAPTDRGVLFSELLPYLDEDALEDQHKISIILQLINNNIQIRKIDLAINQIMSESDGFVKRQAELKNLNTMKKELVASNDKLTKENAIAIKHRGDKKAGRSTLGYLMKDLRELGFEDAEEDYYDMKRAYGMQITADISNKSIISQLNFDEKDIEDMFKEQRDRILELQKQKEELEEKLRLANIELNRFKRDGGDK